MASKLMEPIWSEMKPIPVPRGPAKSDSSGGNRLHPLLGLRDVAVRGLAARGHRRLGGGGGRRLRGLRGLAAHDARLRLAPGLPSASLRGTLSLVRLRVELFMLRGILHGRRRVRPPRDDGVDLVEVARADLAL